jgi:hypothetical protein
MLTPSGPCPFSPDEGAEGHPWDFRTDRTRSQPEIGSPDCRIFKNIGRRAAQNHAPGLQHIGAVGDLQTLGETLFDK